MCGEYAANQHTMDGTTHIMAHETLCSVSKTNVTMHSGLEVQKTKHVMKHRGLHCTPNSRGHNA